MLLRALLHSLIGIVHFFDALQIAMYSILTIASSLGGLFGHDASGGQTA